MFRALLPLALLAVPAVSAVASSYYPLRLDDAKAVYLTPDNFSVHGDGLADDSDALQQAINKVQETTNQGILFVPAGRYRLTRTIYVWPGIRLIGFGATRPVFVLGANTTGFQQGPKYMVFFAGRSSVRVREPRNGKAAGDDSPPDVNPGKFYSAIRNIDIEIQEGNPGAVGIRARYAQ